MNWLELITDEAIKYKHQEVMKKNTVKGEKTPQYQLREYLKLISEQDTNLWKYPTVRKTGSAPHKILVFS